MMARPPLNPNKASHPPDDVATTRKPSSLVLDTPSSSSSATTTTCRSSQSPSSCRNASSSSSSAHFLDGFNVNDCCDVRSIPDPPTPQQQQPHNRRRLSLNAARPRLEDVTNQNSSSISIGSSSIASNKTNTTKRSRRSLCHVPSPAAPEEQRDVAPAIPAQREEMAVVAVKTLQVNICLDDDDGEDEHAIRSSSHKRRKKRQSMVLPQELVQEHVDLFASVSPKVTSPSSSSPKKKKKALFAGDVQSMRELQQLVRGFCALSPEHRDASHQAQAIALLGYPLQQSATGSPVSFSNRKSILQKISPVIALMDKRRVEETQFWEDATDCRVEKSRSGKYRYYSMATNTKVSSHEYENRYMAVLERTAKERLDKSEEWKARLVVLPKPKGNNSNSNSIEKEQDDKEGESLLEEPREIPIICHDVSMEDESESKNNGLDGDSSETQDLDLNLDSLLDTQPREKSASPLNIKDDDDDTMDLCDMSVSLDLGEAISISFEEEEEPASSEPEKQSKTREETPPTKEAGEPSEDIVGAAAETCATPTLDDQEDYQKQPLQGPSAEVEDGPSMLPLPSRDGGSKDPAIARAERNLWNSMDAALQEYSREVMIIMQAKRGGGQRDDPKAVL